MVIGHTKIREYLAAGLRNKTLGHAYALCGPAHVGKNAVARECAASLLGVNEEQLATHPDFYTLSRALDEKTGKRKSEITVAQARALRERLQQRSWAAGYHVAIIEEADFLNSESSNALLKILEEPPQQSLIFLLAHSDDALLPTIRSRVSVLFARRVALAELRAALIQLYSPAVVERVLPFAAGLPGRALTLLQDQEALQIVESEQARWQALRGQPFFKQIAALEPLFAKDESENSRDKFAEVLHWWQLWWAQELAVSTTRADQAACMRVHDSLRAAQQALRQNVNPRLLAEVVIQQF